jgi:hypothetical protein
MSRTVSLRKNVPDCISSLALMMTAQVTVQTKAKNKPVTAWLAHPCVNPPFTHATQSAAAA